MNYKKPRLGNIYTSGLSSKTKKNEKSHLLICKFKTEKKTGRCNFRNRKNLDKDDFLLFITFIINIKYCYNKHF